MGAQTVVDSLGTSNGDNDERRRIESIAGDRCGVLSKLEELRSVVSSRRGNLWITADVSEGRWRGFGMLGKERTWCGRGTAEQNIHGKEDATQEH